MRKLILIIALISFAQSLFWEAHARGRSRVRIKNMIHSIRRYNESKTEFRKLSLTERKEAGEFLSVLLVELNSLHKDKLTKFDLKRWIRNSQGLDAKTKSVEELLFLINESALTDPTVELGFSLNSRAQVELKKSILASIKLQREGREGISLSAHDLLTIFKEWGNTPNFEK